MKALIFLVLFVSLLNPSKLKAAILADFEVDCSAVDGGVGRLEGKIFRFAKAAAKVYICPTSYKNSPEKFDDNCITVKEFPYFKGKKAAKKFLKKNQASESLVGLYARAVQKGFQISQSVFVLALFDHVRGRYLHHRFLDPLLLKPGIGHSENRQTISDPDTGAFLTFQFDGQFIPPSTNFIEFSPPVQALDTASVAKLLGIKENEVRVGHVMRVASMFYEQERNSVWKDLNNLSLLNVENGDFQTLLRKTQDAQTENRNDSLRRYLRHYVAALERLRPKAKRLEREREAALERERIRIERLERAAQAEELMRLQKKQLENERRAKNFRGILAIGALISQDWGKGVIR